MRSPHEIAQALTLVTRNVRRKAPTEPLDTLLLSIKQYAAALMVEYDGDAPAVAGHALPLHGGALVCWDPITERWIAHEETRR